MVKAQEFEKQLAAAVQSLRRRDKKLGAVIKRYGGLKLPRQSPNSYSTLVQIIVGQQLSGKAAATIFGRVRNLGDGRRLTPETVGAISDEALRGAGASWAKIRGIRSLTEHVNDGRLRLRRFPHMSDEEVFDAIVQVKGMGPWSAHMYQMFVLRRLDIFPPGDLGIQKAICSIYGGNRDDTDFEDVAERWRPYRTVACWYLWRSLDNRPEVG